ncbi:MAG: hypothetical protein FWG87_03640 [Defluviitaleaceae bacterium]|nr:hypothetical protein [Defluviitaleaceae bacterium]
MDNISIDFKYKLYNSDKWLKKSITLEEYFDLSLLDKGEQLDVESLPRHDNLINYIDSERQNVYQISVDIIDIAANRKLHFFYTFWNNQKNWLVEVIETNDGCENHHEIIITTVLPREASNNSEPDYEIMRFLKKEDDIKCLYHGIVRDNIDGSQGEVLIEAR